MAFVNIFLQSHFPSFGLRDAFEIALLERLLQINLRNQIPLLRKNLLSWGHHDAASSCIPSSFQIQAHTEPGFTDCKQTSQSPYALALWNNSAARVLGCSFVPQWLEVKRNLALESQTTAASGQQLKLKVSIATSIHATIKCFEPKM